MLDKASSLNIIGSSKSDALRKCLYKIKIEENTVSQNELVLHK